MKQTSTEKGKIYLLVGYLGSGKTTFIRNVLNNKQGKKYAIIQNEFATGQMGIEQPLIMDQSGTPFSNFLQLPNGCICCSAKNDLIASIQYILSNTDVKNIIVETNGLADPGESIKQFWFDQQMKIEGQLHSVISIISVKKFNELQGKQLFEKQIIFANKVKICLKNIDSDNFYGQKYTIISQKAIKLHSRRQSIMLNKTVRYNFIESNNNYDVISFLSGPTLFDMKQISAIQNSQKKQSKILNHQHSHSHHNMHSLFFKGKCSFTSKNQIQQSIGQLLWQSGLKILRTKGIYSLPSSQNVLEMQGIDELFQVKQSNTHKDKYNEESKVLVIGQNIEAQQEKIAKILKLN